MQQLLTDIRETLQEVLIDRTVTVLTSDTAQTVLEILVISIGIFLGALALYLAIDQWLRRRTDDQEPAWLCIHEGMGEDLPRATTLIVYWTGDRAETVPGLRPEQAQAAVEWWRKQETLQAPGSALWIVKGSINTPDGTPAWRDRLVIDVLDISAMRTQTTGPHAKADTPADHDASRSADWTITGTDPEADPFPSEYSSAPKETP